MALIPRVYIDPYGTTHLVTTDEENQNPVPDDWVFVPGGIDSFYASNHAASVAFEDRAVETRTAFLNAQAAAQANRAAVLSALAANAGVDPDALVAALTDTPSSWLVPPADQPSLIFDPLLAAPVDATAIWQAPDVLDITVRHNAEASGSNTVTATLVRDVDLDTESSEVLTIVPGGSEARTFETVSNVELRLGAGASMRVIARWEATSGSTPAWANVPQSNDSTLVPAATVFPTEIPNDPPGETIIRPTSRPGETGAPTNLPGV